MRNITESLTCEKTPLHRLRRAGTGLPHLWSCNDWTGAMCPNSRCVKTPPILHRRKTDICIINIIYRWVKIPPRDCMQTGAEIGREAPWGMLVHTVLTLIFRACNPTKPPLFSLFYSGFRNCSNENVVDLPNTALKQLLRVKSDLCPVRSAKTNARWRANCLFHGTHALCDHLVFAPPGLWEPLLIPRKKNKGCSRRKDEIGTNMGYLLAL